LAPKQAILGEPAALLQAEQAALMLGSAPSPASAAVAVLLAAAAHASDHSARVGVEMGPSHNLTAAGAASAAAAAAAAPVVPKADAQLDDGPTDDAQ
jgi:hypothetical protein